MSIDWVGDGLAALGVLVALLAIRVARRNNEESARCAAARQAALGLLAETDDLQKSWRLAQSHEERDAALARWWSACRLATATIAVVDEQVADTIMQLSRRLYADVLHARVHRLQWPSRFSVPHEEPLATIVREFATRFYCRPSSRWMRR